MALEIYNMVVSIIGPVPIQFEFVYAIGAIFVFIMIIYCLVWPWKLVFGGL